MHLMDSQGQEMSEVTPAEQLNAKCSRGLRQPIEAASIPGALLKAETVSAVTGLSVATLYRLAKAGKLTPIRMGSRCTRWRAADVTAWIRAQGGDMGGAIARDGNKVAA